MVITPMETLTRGVAQLLAEPWLTGEIAEIHGDKVTFRPQHEFVDANTVRNLERFRRLAGELSGATTRKGWEPKSWERTCP